MKTLSPTQVKEKLESEGGKICFIDVRPAGDFLSGHVPGAVCVPLNQIEGGSASTPEGKLVVLGCQAGKRSARAAEVLKQRGFENIVEMEGGFSAWAAAGLPIERASERIPITRQVILTAGALVFLGSALALEVSSWFALLPLAVGTGLVFAGATGWYGPAIFLEWMPWNRGARS